MSTSITGYCGIIFYVSQVVRQKLMVVLLIEFNFRSIGRECDENRGKRVAKKSNVNKIYGRIVIQVVTI